MEKENLVIFQYRNWNYRLYFRTDSLNALDLAKRISPKAVGNEKAAFASIYVPNTIQNFLGALDKQLQQKES